MGFGVGLGWGGLLCRRRKIQRCRKQVLTEKKETKQPPAQTIFFPFELLNCSFPIESFRRCVLLKHMFFGSLCSALKESNLKRREIRSATQATRIEGVNLIRRGMTSMLKC